jgi:hypothetical protein
MKQQMELGLDASLAFRTKIHRQRRLRRAGWWFSQMRMIVERAGGSQSGPPARPEQTYLAPAIRQLDSKRRMEITNRQ